MPRSRTRLDARQNPRRGKKENNKEKLKEAAEVETEEAEAPRRRFGAKTLLVGFIGVGAVAALVMVGMAMWPGKSAKEKKVAKAKTAESAADSKPEETSSDEKSSKAKGDDTSDKSADAVQANKDKATGMPSKNSGAELVLAGAANGPAEGQSAASDVADESLLKLAKRRAHR